jgi:hypothetical protein
MCFVERMALVARRATTPAAPWIVFKRFLLPALLRSTLTTSDQLPNVRKPPAIPHNGFGRRSYTI